LERAGLDNQAAFWQARFIMSANENQYFVIRKARATGRRERDEFSLGITWIILGLALAVLAPRSAQGATVQVFTDRVAWQNAMAGLSLQTETFNDFTGFTYQAAGAPAFQFPAGITDVGGLRFDVDRPSGNLLVGGNFPDSVNGSTFWRIEAATQNGSAPPVTPAVVFSQDAYGFGADWNFVFAPRSTVTFGDTTLYFHDYLGTGIHFLGFTSSAAFRRVEFDVESPFNTLFHADNVSFAQVVPEPSLAGLCLTVFGIMAARHIGCGRRRTT
jgi:hypothetical protein